jgi:multiple sugar transport system permease protein
VKHLSSLTDNERGTRESRPSFTASQSLTARESDIPVDKPQTQQVLPRDVRTTRRARRGAILGRSQRNFLVFLALVLPVIVLRLTTTAYPLWKTASLSLTNNSLLDGTNEYIGFENFRDLESDFNVRSAIEFTVIFVLGSTILELVVGLAVALLLNAKFRGRGFVRSINLIPWAIPPIVAAYAFRWLLDDQFGLIPTWINQVTGDRIAPLISAFDARLSLILVNVWKNAPFMAIVFLAGLQGVPEDLYEAAKIDGARAWQRFWAITLPLLLPLLIAQAMFFVVWQLAAFDLIYGLTNGGPGVATEVLALTIYQEGMLFFRYGFASAVSMILVAIVAAAGLLGLIFFRRREVSF